MNKLVAIALVSSGLAMADSAFAHEAKPKHGGIVRSAAELSFELVREDGAVTIYVDDHGKDKPTQGASGTLTVLTGTRKTELPLASGGNNTLVVIGKAGLEKGSKAVALVNFADKKTVSVRFSVK